MEMFKMQAQLQMQMMSMFSKRSEELTGSQIQPSGDVPDKLGFRQPLNCIQPTGDAPDYPGMRQAMNCSQPSGDDNDTLGIRQAMNCLNNDDFTYLYLQTAHRRFNIVTIFSKCLLKSLFFGMLDIIFLC